MKILNLLLLAVLSIGTYAQSALDLSNISTRTKAFFPITSAFTNGNQLYGYRGYPGERPIVYFDKLDEKMNITETYEFKVTKSHSQNDLNLLKMKENIYVIYSGPVTITNIQTFAKRFDIDRFKGTEEQTVLFNKRSVTDFKTSINEEYVAFISTSDVTVFDQNLKKSWSRKFPRLPEGTYLNDYVVSNDGEVFIYIRFKSNPSKILKLSENDVEFSDVLNSEEAPYTYSIQRISLNGSGDLLYSGYVATDVDGENSGVYRVTMNTETLRMQKEFIALSEEVVTYETSKNGTKVQDNLFAVDNLEPLYLSDKSFFIIGEVRDGSYIRRTILVSKFDKDGKYQWTKHINRNQTSVRSYFQNFGVVPIIKNDKLHVLYNDTKENIGLAEDKPEEIKQTNCNKGAVVFEYVFDTDGNTEVYNPDLTSLGRNAVIDTHFYNKGVNSFNGYFNLMIPGSGRKSRIYVPY